MNKRPYKPYGEYSLEKQKQMPLAYDFLPLTGYQEKYHPKAQCYWLKVELENVVDGFFEDNDIELPGFGVLYQDNKQTIPRAAVAGGRHPFDRTDAPFDVVDLEDLCKVIHQYSTFTNFTIREIGLRYPIPRELQSDSLFEGANYIAHEMQSRGNQGQNFEQKTGLPTFDPYRAMKRELKKRDGDIEAVEKRLRGHLVTRGLIADNGVNHWDMAQKGRGRLGLALQNIHYADYHQSSSSDFTRDMGIPFELATKNPQSPNGRMYDLTKNDAIMTA